MDEEWCQEGCTLYGVHLDHLVNSNYGNVNELAKYLIRLTQVFFTILNLLLLLPMKTVIYIRFKTNHSSKIGLNLNLTECVMILLHKLRPFRFNNHFKMFDRLKTQGRTPTNHP